MLFAMTSKAYRECIETKVIKEKILLYNYDSLYQVQAVSLNDIYPYGKADAYQITETDQKNFDLCYANFLIGDVAANNCMLMMMYNLYIGIDVVILINQDQAEFAQMILESYFKFIQQRYGVKASYIFDMADYELVDRTQKIFSYQGLYYWDIDKIKVADLIMERSKQDPHFARELNLAIARSAADDLNTMG